MQLRQVYTAKRTMKRSCEKCHAPIVAGEKYHKRLLRGARDASAKNRYIEHVNCRSWDQGPIAKERIRRERFHAMPCQDTADERTRKLSAIRGAIAEHILDHGMVTDPDTLRDRIYVALYGHEYD